MAAVNNSFNNSFRLMETQKINQGKSTEAVNTSKTVQAESGNSFQSVLNLQLEKTQITNKAAGITFSKHANMRLSARDISLSDDQLKRVENGVSKASLKGITDSLVLVDDVALVVNIKNKHVVTAMEKSQSDEKIFTNINGAVIV